MKSCSKCAQLKPPEGFYATGRICRVCQCLAAKAYRQANPEAAKAADKVKHAKRRPAALESMKARHRKNAAARSIAEKARYQKDSERIKQRTRAYRMSNVDKVYVWNGSRRAVEKRATPGWADRDLMASYYKLARIYSAALGRAFHVDHQIPLKGKIVCGLHVHDNLCVLLGVNNLRKGTSLCGA